MSKPLQIGVTGGIGSGKSMVCRLFSCLGIPVYEADVRAKWLTNHHPGIREKVVALLGEAAYDASGRYVTSYVSSKVFQDDGLLQKLNGIIHPVVMEDTVQWVRAHADYTYVIKEAAIMNKAGDHNSLDYVIVVEAPEAIRVQRILKRDSRSEEQIRAIMQRQVSDDQRRKVADFCITNDDHTPLIPQVMRLHNTFQNRI